MTDKELIQKLAEQSEKHPKRLSEWEIGFIDSVAERAYLTDNQREQARRILSEKSGNRKSAADARQDQWDAAAACEKCLDGIVVMRLALTDAERAKTLSYEAVAAIHQYREAAFPCVCARGSLRQEWQKFPISAAIAHQQGWRRKEIWEKEMTE